MEPSLSGDNPLHSLHHPHHHPHHLHHHLHQHAKPPAAVAMTTAASAASPSHPVTSQPSMGTPQQQQHRAHDTHEDRPPGAPPSSMGQAAAAAAPASSAPPVPAATGATAAAPGIGVASHRDSSGALSSLGSASNLSTSATSPRERHWRLDHSQFAAARKDPAEAVSSASSSALGRGPWMLRSNSKHAISGYYRRQNEMIDGFSEMDALSEQLLPPSLSEEREAEKLAKSERFAIRLSNYCNIFLLAAKIVAAVQSRSLSIIASALDSLLDLLSGFILWYTAWSMRRQNPYKYPIGKKRMQPLGIIVFASIMAMLGLQILVEAVRQLFSTEHNAGLGENWQVYVGIMVLAIAMKLGLFLYCRQFDNDIVAAYAQDHFFDVVTNVIGLAAAVLAAAFAWWIDPVGAILLSLYTMVNWGRTVQENVRSLTGRTAPPEFLQKLTYLCWNHHEAILMIDTVRAYTFGNSYFTEVDVVLPREMPLQEAHDIGESLQNKLERLPEIERAFVHLDYEVSHRPEHHHHYSTFVVPTGGASVARDPEETVVTPRDEDESVLSGKGRHPHRV